ncbi:MAG TPA: bifunctional 2-C-methyl-D-erythritol 4-phosphate cytidylyltransferase/2-C-methyl-D-erythritol 2,4-cyclodiphosphate synthase [Rhodospirillaceae bacterium]|nr:bifunctional 2-C-methyl-D-erythritol 4-phosphate cytidylyltransferase/2-C-methyl-D-erythritol 2,4-cyclodiphosphate synthase [Rhodospirillaceae bacterium]
MNENTPFSDRGDCTVIIVAAGSGARFGDSLPKQYHQIHGRTVLHHTIRKFANHPAITRIQVVIADGFQDLYADSVSGFDNILPPVIGGATRQASVYNALSALSLTPDDIVLIHDAARPCVTTESIDALIDSLKTHQAASLAIPVSDTIRKSNADRLAGHIDRDGLYAMQTPQAFHFGVIRSAHEKFKTENFTDDTSLVSEMGIPVLIVTGHRENIKITTAEDLMIAAKYLQPSPLIPRTGLGFDVHAFGAEAATIRIGGIDIPHTHRLKGHSDADVLLHAITDALYGVIADGDIGSHFPPNNPAYKGKDSAFFLEEAVKAVNEKGGRIVHVDSVIMCEAPKIGPHRDAMQKRVADILHISPTRVSIKATTTEELGFTGRREGIAAQAIVTVLLPDEDDYDI